MLFMENAFQLFCGGSAQKNCVPLGIYPFKNAVLIFSTTCNAYINLVTEYEATQMWSENGTIFHVYKPLHGKSGSSLCLGFVPDTTEPKPKILVYNLDQNCQINRQKRKVISSTQTLLLYEGKKPNGFS